VRIGKGRLIIGIIGIAAIMSGCAITQETKQSLLAYTTAMQQVQVSTDKFLIDYSSVADLRRQLEQTLASDAPNSYPASYNPRLRSGTSIAGADTDIQARRSALAAVAAYNDALVALAEGQSEAAVSAHLKSFGGGIETVLGTIGITTASSFGAVLPLASKLAALIQDGLNKAEFTEALNLGQPIIEAILAQLESDTAHYYAASIVVTERERDKVKSELRGAVPALRRLAGQSSAPTEENPLIEVRKIERTLNSIGIRTDTSALMPESLPFDAGKPKLDLQALERIKVSMKAIESIAKQDAEIVAKQNAYYDLMDAYVATLRQTSASLLFVSNSLDKPIDFNTQAGLLLDTALNLRSAFDEYRAAR
jgi:hypothetical protein